MLQFPCPQLRSVANLLIRTSAANENEFTFYGYNVLFPNIHIGNARRFSRFN